MYIILESDSLQPRRNLRKYYLVSGLFFCMTDFKAYDEKLKINGKDYEFYLNNKTHKWIVWIDGEPQEFTKAKGQAIIDFLKMVGD